ncbi:reticulon-like protein of the endoplasmic reticulum [Podila humilis]|nr:reticulon-like protein of the endoplasmic reticulum [Podila humilis]
MDQDNSSLDYLKVDHPAVQKPFAEHQSTVTENAAAADSHDTTPARRERSSTDSTKSSHDHKTASHHEYHAYMTPRLKSLVLWENPAKSGAVLGGALALVLSCRWVSLLNVACAALVFGISGSFLYVNGLLLFNRITNKQAVRPLEKYYARSTEFLHLESDTLHRRVDTVTEALNVALTELAKIVLIEDNKRSLIFIGLSYIVWTLRTWFSTTTLLSMILVTLFATPRLYLDNQTLIDTHVAKTSTLAQEHLGRGRQMAQDQWTNVYSKVETLAKEKGLMKKSEKKTE